MAKAILVEGLTGTGKSFSLRDLPPAETAIFTPNNKPLSFRGHARKYRHVADERGPQNIWVTPNLVTVQGGVSAINKLPNIKYLVIEDFTHLLSEAVMHPDFVRDTGYAKWNKLAASIQAALFAQLPLLREDLTLIIIHHTTLDDTGKYVFQSVGKLLDNLIKPVSHFTYVLHAVAEPGSDGIGYKFITNRTVMYEAKTPPEMFPSEIPNNIMDVIKRIEEYDMEEV